MKRTGMSRFKFSLDSLRTQSDTYEVALQGHSGRHRVDPTLQNHVLVPYTWTDFTYCAGISFGLSLHHRGRSRCRENRKPGGKTNLLLHDSQSFRNYRRRFSVRGRRKASHASIQVEVEKAP